MILREISITHFKNIRSAALQFSPKINCLLGDNGMGKSNLLDAIHFLSFCKSFTGAPDSMLITQGETFAMVQGQYTRAGAEETITAALQVGRPKSFKRTGKEYRRLSEHIGKFPLVLISPSDMDLITGAGEERRRFLDMLISQASPQYLAALIRYNRGLDQRNRLLRDGASDPSLFLAIEQMMEMDAEVIAQMRRENIQKLTEIFRPYYASISGGAETPDITYTTHLEPGTRLTDLFNSRRARDVMMRHTTAGPHRDDLEFTVDGLPVRRLASQGQSKTFTIALRLAQYMFLRQSAGAAPLLLLDDIFDKLDSSRVSRIMQLASRPEFGQIFITDTNRSHLDEVVAAASSPYALWTVEGGIFTPVTEFNS